MSGSQHWNDVYAARPDDQLTWHQDAPDVSLDLARMAGVDAGASVIDVGGGMSRFAAALWQQGVRDITVLDLSQVALDASRARMGGDGDLLHWICADITRWTPTRRYDLWHDRAVFHFLTEAADRAAYVAALTAALPVGGHAIIASFAPDGPEKCSGLPVVRYSPATLAAELGDRFAPVAERAEQHRTPLGRTQSFQYSLFRKVG